MLRRVARDWHDHIWKSTYFERSQYAHGLSQRQHAAAHFIMSFGINAGSQLSMRLISPCGDDLNVWGMSLKEPGMITQRRIHSAVLGQVTDLAEGAWHNLAHAI